MTIPNNTIIENSYRILGLVGEGSIGAVYKAQQFNPDRMVALKVMHDHVALDPENKKRFQREVKSLALLRHPNIVTIYRYGITSDGLPFFATEYLSGKSIASILKGELRLPAQRALAILYQILRGVAFAHDVGIYHRNLKPSNIIVVNAPVPDTVKILDFGAAKFRKPNIRFASANDNLTQTGMVMGSIQYMSPEQARGLPVDHRSDLYACGQIFYEMITGEKNCSALETLYGRESISPFERSDTYLPKEIEPILKRALAIEPKDRYQSAVEFMEDIAAILPVCIANYGKHPSSIALRAKNEIHPREKGNDFEVTLPGQLAHVPDHKIVTCGLIATAHLALACILAGLFPHLQLVCWAGGSFLALANCYALLRQANLFLILITGELFLAMVCCFLLCIRIFPL